METERIVGLASSIGALVGGVVGFAVNWWWKWRAEADRIQVHYGTAHYEETPAYGMHVINRSGHKVEVTHYGFVLGDGSLYSIPEHWAQSFGDDASEDLVSGSTLLQGRNDRYEALIHAHLKEGVIGAYARTAAQKQLSFDFPTHTNVTMWRRWRLRVKHWR
ncbi:hypothetical protein QTH91_14585 [Variovorax dokdonensis]|uniref:Uncharacterized protein n=1 Tax=Variovorax dokdonensis TaxID=344883 RepID=A0ABT7NCQ8_9BURK|nr:hypothetical protein [Variovorax dokdonensis]MDM0045714.1 hypothetical protein [Variovorax dokdonensis]